MTDDRPGNAGRKGDGRLRLHGSERKSEEGQSGTRKPEGGKPEGGRPEGGRPEGGETDRPATPSARDVQRWLAYERNHLANERTYAAWLRTGLSLCAVGIAVAHFLPEERRTPLLSVTVGTGFVLAGLALIVFGAWRYERTHRELSEASGERTRIVAPRVVYAVTLLVAALLLSVLVFV